MPYRYFGVTLYNTRHTHQMSFVIGEEHEEVARRIALKQAQESRPEHEWHVERIAESLDSDLKDVVDIRQQCY